MVSVWKKMLIGKLCSICYNELEIEMIFLRLFGCIVYLGRNG